MYTIAQVFILLHAGHPRRRSSLILVPVGYVRLRECDTNSLYFSSNWNVARTPTLLSRRPAPVLAPYVLPRGSGTCNGSRSSLTAVARLSFELWLIQTQQTTVTLNTKAAWGLNKTGNSSHRGHWTVKKRHTRRMIQRLVANELAIIVRSAAVSYTHLTLPTTPYV